MRYLLLSLLLACTGFASAQCFINAELENVECDPLTGEAVVTFFINGEGSSWFSPTLDLEGPYDSNASFTTQPFDLSATGGIQFVDQQFPDCQFFLPIDSLICETNCSNLLVFVEEEGLNPCGSTEDQLFYVWVESASVFPVTVEIFDTPANVVATEVLQQPQGIPFDVPFGAVYTVRVTDSEDCVFEQDVVNAPVECGTITGRSWLDNNGNGLQDIGETEAVGATLSLFRGGINGQLISTTTTDGAGNYSFSGIEPWLWYSVSIVGSQDLLELTLFNQGNDPAADNDFSPAISATGANFINPGATVTLDAGWRSDPCTLLDVSIFPTDQPNDCGATTYVLTVLSDAFPVDVIFFTDSMEVPELQFSVDENGTFPISGLLPGGYNVQITNAANCVRAFDFFQDEAEGLEVFIRQEGSFCTGDLVLTAEVLNAGGDYSYSWSNGDDGQFIIPTSANTVYQVIVTSDDGCSGVGQAFVSQSFSDTIDVPEVVVLNCDGSPTTITIANPVEGFTYTWFGPQNDLQTGTSITISNSGWYEIEGTNGEGCSTFGFTQILDLNLNNVYIEGFGQDSICGTENCIYLAGLGQQFNTDNIEIDWDGPPSFNEWADSLDFPVQQFCGVPEGTYTVTVRTVCDTVVLTYDNNNLECSEISGTLYLDAAGDCDLDGDDLPAPGFIVTITNEATGEMYYAWTGSNGNWSVELPNGVYTIEPIIEPGQPLTTCPATTVALNGNAVTGVNIFMPVLESCPVLTTEVTIPFLRRCFTGCAYVNYENTGTATGEDAQVVVVLDPFFIDVIPSVDPVSVVGNVYTFDLGDLPPFSNGSIGFIFTVSCEAELGQSHCIDASITPDDPCGADPAWNGALVDITSVVCEGGSVLFTVTNIGDSQMSIPLSYVIVEDGIMLSANPFTNGLLEPGEDFLVAVEAEGATVALITNQEPNAPGSEEPSLVFEGCNGNGETFTTGFTNLLPLNSGNPASSFVCRENVGSYDPNDKMGYPLGWGDNNIAPGTRLDYEIRFQNTGTDTAFTVVISDTLAPELDLATFKMEATSHPVSVTIDTFRVVTWTFNNILLPDSTTNLLLSQGSVVFSIDHAASLEGGDEILNEAAIYFDFNEPVITNVSRHVIAKDGLPTSVRAALARSVPLEVYPNPAVDRIHLRMAEQDFRATDVLTVTDLHGRRLLTRAATSAGSGVDVSTLPAGYYVVVLTDAAGHAKGRTPFVITR